MPASGIRLRRGPSHAKSNVRGYEGNENSRKGIELASIRKLVIHHSQRVVEKGNDKGGTAAQSGQVRKS
jgi:hypothetical protein